MNSGTLNDQLNAQPALDPMRDNPEHPLARSGAGRYPKVNLVFTPHLASTARAIPADTLRRLTVIPFGRDDQHKTISVACANPDQSDMVAEVSSCFPDMTVELYLADPESIGALIDRMSSQPEQSNDAVSEAGQPAEAATEESSQAQETKQEGETADPAVVEPSTNQPQSIPRSNDQKVVLFITESGKVSPHLLFAFNAERFVPRSVDSAEAALALIPTLSVERVFIEKGSASKCQSLARKLKELQPAVSIRYFATEAGLLLNDTTDDLGNILFQKNLELLSLLTSRKANSAARHATAVAHLAAAMSVRLNLPVHLRPAVLTAAFLHNVAQEDLNSIDGYDHADIIGLSAGRLTNWDYPEVITQMLRNMYREVTPSPSVSAGAIECGAEMLTAADCFNHTWPDIGALATRQLNHVQDKLHELVGKCVSAKVLAALIDTVRDDITAHVVCHSRFRVHLFLARGTLSTGLETALNGADFTVSASETLNECAEFCCQSVPRILLIRDSGTAQDVYELIVGLAMRGVTLDQLNTVLLLEESTVTDAMRLLRHGVADVLPANADPAAIIAKLEQINARIDDSTKQRLAVLRELGTHGSLEDVNLVDLLEIWKTNKRPVCISVTAHSNQLTIFVDRGRIMHAECLDAFGTDAILKGLAWQRGAWSIDTVDPAALPSPNVDQDIDSVLLEACVRLDRAALLG